MTDDKLRFFTDHGNVFSIAAEEIAECKLKDRGVNAAALLSGLGKDEQVVSLLVLPEKDCDVLFFTKQGMVKRTAVSEYQKTRGKLLACGLKGTDSVMKAVLLPQNCELILVAKDKRHSLSDRFHPAAGPHGCRRKGHRAGSGGRSAVCRSAA